MEKKKILIVDDSPETIDVLCEKLNGNYIIKATIDSSNAVEIAERETPDIILLDVVMPGINGYEICRRLKQNPLTRDIPVIFITVRDDIIDEEQGFLAGAVDYIAKPIIPSIVKARVETHISLRKYQLHLENLVDEKTVEIQNQLKEKQLLIKEMNHRVNNNLQLLSSLINIQRRNETDLKVVKALSSFKKRIYTIALIHNELYKSDTISEILMKRFLTKIIENDNADSVIDFEIDDFGLPLTIATYCGLLVSELIDVVQYFSDSKEKTSIKVIASIANDTVSIFVIDKNTTISENYDIINSKNLSFILINLILTQLNNGTIKKIHSHKLVTFTASFNVKI